MPILFIVLGIIFLFEMIIVSKYRKSFGCRLLILLQFIFVLISYFIKPIVISDRLGFQIFSVSALLLGLRITKKNLIPTILGTGTFLFAYLLATLYNYELLSIISSSFYFVLLLCICSVSIMHPYLLSNIARLSVLTSFVIDYFLVKDIGGFVIIGNIAISSFALILSYVGLLIYETTIRIKEEKKHEKMA